MEFDEMDIYSYSDDAIDEMTDDDSMSAADAGFIKAWRDAEMRDEQPDDEEW